MVRVVGGQIAVSERRVELGLLGPVCAGGICLCILYVGGVSCPSHTGVVCDRRGIVPSVLELVYGLGVRLLKLNDCWHTLGYSGGPVYAILPCS